MAEGISEENLWGHLHGIKPPPSNMEAIKIMWPPKNVKQVWAFLGLVGCYLKFIKRFYSNCKTAYNSYTSWCKILLDTKPPSSIHQLERSSHRSTHTSLPRPFKTIHSLHRCLWWCLWCSNITGTQWPGITNCIPTHIHSWILNWKGRTPKQEAYGIYYAITKVELLSTGIWHHPD